MKATGSVTLETSQLRQRIFRRRQNLKKMMDLRNSLTFQLKPQLQSLRSKLKPMTLAILVTLQRLHKMHQLQSLRKQTILAILRTFSNPIPPLSRNQPLNLSKTLCQWSL